MRSVKPLISFVFLALAALAIGQNPVAAQTSVRIVVNGIPITNYDINQRVRILGISGMSATQNAAREELINEAVQLAEARQRGVTVPQAQIDGAFAQIAQSTNMTPNQLSNVLSQQGIAVDSLKSRIRAQLAWYILVQQRLQQQAVPNEDIMAALFAEGDAAAATTTEYILQQIIFVVPEGSSSGVYQQRRREAENFRIRYGGCEGALAQARGLRDVVVRDIGRRTAAELGGAQGAAVQRTDVGRATSPTQTDSGIEIIGVCSKRAVQSTAEARAAIENRLSLEKGEEIGQDYLAELRAAALIDYR